MRSRGLLAIILLASAFGGAQAYAHHSVTAQFDLKKWIPATAVLVDVRAINPHSQWTFEIKNKAGAAETWHFEGENPAMMRRSGIRVREDLVVGKAYDITYSPSLNGSASGLMTSIKVNGKLVRMSPPLASSPVQP